jgi:tetratricopeptide (TPR) repeat protein
MSQKIDEAVRLYNAGQCESAAALVEGMLDDPSALFILAQTSYRAKVLPEATRLMERAVEKKPDFVLALYYLGIFHSRTGTLSGQARAKETFEKALRFTPDFVDALVGVGETSWFSAQIDESLTALNRAIQLQPAHAHAHFRLSQVYAQEGHRELAELHLTEAARLNPNIREQVSKDLLEIESGKLEVKRAVNRARYPSTKLLKGDFADLFQKEFANTFKDVAPFISSESKIFTMGSCFAKEIAKSFMRVGYQATHLEVTEVVNTTFANRCLVDWLAGQLQGSVAERIEELVAKLGTKEAVIGRIKEAALFVLTLGVAPVFFDRKTGDFIMPRPSSLNTLALAEKYEFRTTSVEDNVSNILHVIGYIRSVNPHGRIFLTVSPVPLGMTFEYASAVIADCVSKSVLRVAADQVVRRGLAGVHYWPSFEIVRWFGAHNGPVFGVDDNSEFHVSEDLVNRITLQFIETFLVV